MCHLVRRSAENKFPSGYPVEATFLKKYNKNKIKILKNFHGLRSLQMSSHMYEPTPLLSEYVTTNSRNNFHRQL